MNDMAFYIQNFRQAQVFTKAWGQRLLSLQTLTACQPRYKSTKPSFIQWNTSLDLSGRPYVLTKSKFHHIAGNNLRSELHLRNTKPTFPWKRWLGQSGRTGVPKPMQFHHFARHTLRRKTHLKRKPSQWHSLELSDRTHVPTTSNFHHLAENTLNSNAAYILKLGDFIFKPTEANTAILERMGVKVHYVDSLRATGKLKEAGFCKKVSSEVTETDGTHR